MELFRPISRVSVPFQPLEKAKHAKHLNTKKAHSQLRCPICSGVHRFRYSSQRGQNKPWHSRQANELSPLQIKIKYIG